MSGHSKWSTIKRKKGANDAKRGKIFTKLIREITVAARDGGGDPAGNPRLRTAIAAARAQNMPNENVERAIKRGTGELEGVNYEEHFYEGYGPGGVAVLVEALTDSKLRTVSEVRHLFTRFNGSMGEAGCVSWNFETKGLITVDKKLISEEDLMEKAIDAGAEDIRDEGKVFEVITSAQNFEAVRNALEKHKISMMQAEVTKIPKTWVEISGKDAENMVKLVEALEDNDDIQRVYNNSDIPEEVLESLAS